MLDTEIAEIIELYADYDAVEAYAAGMDDRPRRLYRPSPENAEAILERVERARKRLGQIEDEELRVSGEKILNSISVDARYPRPDIQVAACAVVLLCVLLKKDEGKEFLAYFLRDAEDLIRFENGRLAEQKLTAEAAKLCLNSADFLEATLSTLGERRADISQEIEAVRTQLAGYRALFKVDGLDAHEFEQLFRVLEANNAGAHATPGYEEMLRDLYDYGMTGEEIRARARALLDEEMRAVGELSQRLIPQLGLTAGSDLGEVYDAMERRFAISGSQFEMAERVMRVSNNYTEFFIQDLDNRSFVGPESAPAHLTDLITSGATVVLDYLKPEPLVKVYFVEGRNKSLLTMINVLVHEGTHAHRGLASAGAKMPPLLRRRTYLSIPLNEGMAFHRELEFYNAARETLEVSRTRYFEHLPGVVADLLALFGDSAAERELGVTAFEMETRIWRVVRFVRAICDVEVNMGMTSYVDFVNWARERTGLTKKFIHDECFTFLSNPGYTPSYAICGTIYAEAQAQRRARGVSDKSFNTQAGRLGFFPWSVCKTKLSEFGAEPTSRPLIPREQPAEPPAES